MRGGRLAYRRWQRATPRLADEVSYRMWQSKRHGYPKGVDLVNDGRSTVADSTNRNQTSTAEAAWSMPLDQFQRWLETEYHATDAKTGKPLYWTAKEGVKDRKTTTDVTDWPVMKLPSAPNLGANISAEWQSKMLAHPLAHEHLDDDGKTPAYKDELARMSRYAAYLVIGETEGQVKVTKEYRDAFRDWYKAFEDEQSARLSKAREGAKAAQETAKKAVAKTSAQQQTTLTMYQGGMITEELARTLLMAGEDSADEAAVANVNALLAEYAPKG